MRQPKKIVIGLFGFGVVGEGLYKILQKSNSIHAEIKKICIKDIKKKRSAPIDLFTNDKDEILNDDSINVVVEVINNTDEAFEIVSIALQKKKHVVSASKKMLSEHLQVLMEYQQKLNVSLLYESAACASIPIIRNLEEYYDNDLLHSLSGIVNGSTNYILTKMFEDKLSFQEALINAKQLGFAETNAALDVEGYDAVHKWILLLNHAFGFISTINEISFQGIQNIQTFDADIAKEKGYQIKFVATAKKLSNGKIAALVYPQFVKSNSFFYQVKNEYNAVIIETAFADKQFFYGKGAGSYPTASALLSDISALRYNYKYEYKKLNQKKFHTLSKDFYLRVYVSFKNRNRKIQEHFISIEEYFVGEKRNYICGIIEYENLEKICNSSNDNSLILFPDSIFEKSEIKKNKRKSLELAGVGV